MACRNLFTAVAAAALAVAAYSAPASAQVMYGGYNLGPDYGAMIRQQQALAAQQQQQMMAQQQQIVAQVMQLPHFQQMYYQYRSQGGHLSPQQYAVEYAARGRFTEDGMRNFQNSRNQIEANDRRAMEGYRAAEENRRRAQQQYMDGGNAIAQERGYGLSGRGTYVGPDGGGRVMSYMQPGQIQTDAQGNRYVMNNQGQYFMATPNGWVPMQPRY